MAQQTRKQKLKEDLQKQRRRRTITTTIIVALVMIVIIVVIILVNRPSPGNPLIGQPIPQAMYATFSGVSDNALATAKGSGGISPLFPQTYQPAVTTSTKPEFLYIGAEYCPFCAAERWSMLVALSRFGNFTGVEYMISTANDQPASVPTFSFRAATYNSQYLTFVSHEVQDRNRTPTSDQPTTAEKALWDYFDPGEGIPFIDIGNSAGTHFLIGNQSPHSGSQFAPTILSGNWTQIASQLDSTSSSIALNVNSAADTLIHSICSLDGQQPSSVCTQTYAQVPFAAGQAPPALNSIFLTLDRSTSKSWTG